MKIKVLILIVALIFLYIPSPVYATGIAFDYAVAPTYGGSSSITVTFSHTIGAGSNMILFVSATGNQSPTATLTATYNGTSMTELCHSIDNVGTGVPTYLFYMKNPPSGAHNVVVTSSTAKVVASSISYSGVIS